MSQPISSGEVKEAPETDVGVEFVGREPGRMQFAPARRRPTTSMSGSFQCPGPAYFSCPAWAKPIPAMLCQVSVMSSVVRQELPPTWAPTPKRHPIHIGRG